MRSKRLSMLAVTPVLLLSIVGLYFGRVVPSALASWIGGLAAAGMAMAVVVRTWEFSPDQVTAVKEGPSQRIARLLLDRRFRAPFYGLCTLMLGWFSFVWAAPWAYTASFGEPAVASFLVAEWTGGTRGSCRRPVVVGYGHYGVSFRAFCAPGAEEHLALQGQTIEAKGRRSRLGMSIESWRLPVAPNNSLERSRGP